MIFFYLPSSLALQTGFLPACKDDPSALEHSQHCEDTIFKPWTVVVTLYNVVDK